VPGLLQSRPASIVCHSVSQSFLCSTNTDVEKCNVSVFVVVRLRWILTKNYKELMRGSKSSISSFINLVMELKKCCNHAFLIRSPETSDTLNKSRFEVVIN